VYLSSCSSTLFSVLVAVGPPDIADVSGLGGLDGDRNALEASTLGGLRLIDQVPHGSLGSGMAWTLKVRVVRRAKLLTIMA